MEKLFGETSHEVLVPGSEDEYREVVLGVDVEFTPDTTVVPYGSTTASFDSSEAEGVAWSLDGIDARWEEVEDLFGPGRAGELEGRAIERAIEDRSN